MAMSDGRYDPQRLIDAVKNNSRATLLLDLEAIAREAGAMINAVMLGAIAGARALPIAAEAFEAAIRADGKAVDANLRGFSAGFAAASAGSRLPAAAPPRPHAPSPALADLECEIATMPAAAQAVMIEGVRRLAAYQDVAYARLYLDRLNPLRDADAKAGAAGRLLDAVARQLALRMSYEDVIRVAQAIDPARLTRIVREMDVRPGQTFAITEYLNPGLDEFCSILPGFLARGLLAVAARFPALARARWGMAINSRSISGYLRFALLAKLRPLRRATFRFQQEQEVVRQAIDAVTSARTAGIARSGRRSLGQVPRRAGASAGSRHRRRIDRAAPEPSRATIIDFGGHLLRVRRHGSSTRAKIRAAQNRKPQNRAPQDGKSWVEPPLVGARDARKRCARSRTGRLHPQRSEKDRGVIETLGDAKPPPQGRSLSLGAVHADLLHQSRRQEPAGKPA
jgi:hypothetical protein